MEFLREAADNGNAEAMFLLAVCCAQGKKTEQNYREAARWFHAAAKKGHARAMTSLAFLYSRGRGVQFDQRIAFRFFTQAQERGDPLAADLLSRLRSQMAPATIAEAERALRNRQIA